MILEMWVPRLILKQAYAFEMLSEFEYQNKCLICFTAGVSSDNKMLVTFDNEEDYVVFSLRYL